MSCSAEVRAADRYWVGLGGYWDEVAHWSDTPGGAGGFSMPANGDNVFIISNSFITVTRDGFTPGYSPPGPALVRLAGTGGALVTLDQNVFALPMAAVRLEVGNAGAGRYVHTSNSNTVDQLLVGTSPGGVGTYVIGSGTAPSLLATNIEIGSNVGVGTFVHNDGQVTASTFLVLGSADTTARGYYEFAGGTLSAGFLHVGDFGAGSLTQTGGTGSAALTLIGNGGTGVFGISGGSFTTSGLTRVGTGSLVAGSLTLAGAGDYRASGGLTISPLGRVTQNAGSLSVSGSMTINGGRFDYNGGSFLPAAGTTINITGGGTAAINASFYFLPNNTGLNITNGTLAIAQQMNIGDFATGSLLVNGSSARVTAGSGYVVVGGGSGSGTATFTAGARGAFDLLYVGSNAGTGVLNVTAGASLTLNRLLTGTGNGVGAVNLSGPNSFIFLNAPSGLRLGEVGTGSLNISTGAGFFAGTGTQLIARGGNVTVNGGSFSASSVVVDGGTVRDLSATFYTSNLTIKNGGLVQFAGSPIHSAEASVSVQSDGVYDLGSNDLYMFDGNSIVVDGGRLNVGSIYFFGGGDFQFRSGTCDFRGFGGLNIGAGGVLDNELHLTPGKALLVTHTTTHAPGALVALEGGVFSTGSMTGTGSFSLATGTLRLTASNLTVGAGNPIGSAFQVNTGARVEITGSGQAVVQPGAVLFVGGGSISAAGGLVNSGEVQLAGGASRISGATFTNNGLLRGNGRIDNSLVNASTGTVRAAAADSLLFTGASNTNAGTVQLLGGVVEFQQALTNTTTGRINGRGSLFTAALTNNGSMTLSGGPAEVFGNVTNTATARVLVTGGSSSTFYNNVTNQAGSQFKVSDASVAAFLGTVIGLAAFSGNGTTIFEGPASFGPLARSGTTIVQPAGAVTADHIRETTLVISGAVTITSKGTANDPSGTSVVKSLAIDEGTLNLTNNSMIIDYDAPVGSLVDHVRQHLQTGRLTSTSATLLTDLGYGDNTLLNRSSFAGQAVDESSLLIKFTYLGDTDLDGDVDVADLGNLATNWQTAGAWTGGDFDYSGSIDVNDLGLLATNWQAGVGSPLSPTALPRDLVQALASFGLPSVTVPEPACAGLLLTALSWKRPRKR
jgi:hypothetical protein